MCSYLHVVTVIDFISKHVELIVEDHSWTLLAFEFNADSVLSSIQQLDLNVSLLSDNNSVIGDFFLLFLLPLLDVVESPSFRWDVILGAVLIEDITQLLKNLLGGVVCEEGCRLR